MNDAKEIVTTILEFLRDFGIYGVLVIVIILLVHKPERAVALKALLIQPLFKFFKLGSKQYIAAKVGYTVSTFMQSYLKDLVRDGTGLKIRLKWVKSADDPILKANGTIILRMQETDDQTRNILSAARYAFPLVVCHDVRQSVQTHLKTAVDLTLLRRFSESLGRNARPIFQRYFLTPESDADNKVNDVFTKLVEIDERGIFVALFLQELDFLGEALYSSAVNADKTAEIISLLDYLLVLARRGVGEQIPLEYFSEDFRIGIMIVAIEAKAREKGVEPYVRRIDTNIKKGCESIYVIAYSRQFPFLDRILTAMESDFRVLVHRRHRARFKSKALGDEKDTHEIAVMRRNAVFEDTDFTDYVNAAQIKEGSRVSGIVVDIAERQSLVDVDGLKCCVLLHDASWYVFQDCAQIFGTGDQLTFQIKRIDPARQRIELSRRIADTDPWATKDVPRVGDVLESKLAFQISDAMIAFADNGIQMRIPLEEMSWMDQSEAEVQQQIGTTAKVKVIQRLDDARVLLCSIRQLETDPWPAISRRWPRGTRLRGTVVEVTSENVRLQLDGGVSGLIARDLMQSAGYELADFEQTVVVGQKLDVIVVEVFPRRKRIRLDLQRNNPRP